jgi:aminoglycoside phosphotransferase
MQDGKFSNLPSLPRSVTALIHGYDAIPVGIGLSSASVFCLEAPDRQPLVLKCANAFDDVDLEDEAGRLRWLAKRATVPEPLACGATAELQYLLMRAIPGRNAAELDRADAPAIVPHLADALRALHAVPLDACPFDQRLDAQLTRASRRVAARLVDESDFDAARAGWTADEVLAAALKTRPPSEDLVITHGDACMPNVMFAGGRFTGFVDLSRAGVADRYQDLALATRSIFFNFGETWVHPFFEAYGLADPDEPRLEFYRLLDELF